MHLVWTLVTVRHSNTFSLKNKYNFHKVHIVLLNTIIVSWPHLTTSFEKLWMNVQKKCLVTEHEEEDILFGQSLSRLTYSVQIDVSGVRNLVGYLFYNPDKHIQMREQRQTGEWFITIFYLYALSPLRPICTYITAERMVCLLVVYCPSTARIISSQESMETRWGTKKRTIKNGKDKA